MSCTLLAGEYMFSCSASREVYVPSRFELNEYCTSSRYPLCPCYTRSRSETGANSPAPGRYKAVYTGKC